jgi:cytoskeletal protein CcmA (bactofilin family)
MTAAPPAPSSASSAAPPKAAAPPAPPRVGTLSEDGAVRHDAVHAVAWSFHGTAKVIGDADAGTLTARGDLSVGGALIADRLESRGTLETVGPIRVAGPASGRGEIRSGNLVRAVDLDVRGILRAGGAVTVDRTLRVDGTLFAPSVETGELRLDGTAEVPGTVAALAIDLRLRGQSSFGTLRAKRVRVVGKIRTPVDEALFRRYDVKVERIEADEAEIEEADVAFVHAAKVVLGRGAHVTTVEGTVTKRHASARVGPESKSTPPYGLRR